MFAAIIIIGLCAFLATASARHLEKRKVEIRGTITERAKPFMISPEIEKEIREDIQCEEKWDDIWSELEQFKRDNYALCSVQTLSLWLHISSTGGRRRFLYKDFRWGLWKGQTDQLVETIALTRGGHTIDGAKAIANKIT